MGEVVEISSEDLDEVETQGVIEERFSNINVKIRIKHQEQVGK